MARGTSKPSSPARDEVLKPTPRVATLRLSVQVDGDAVSRVIDTSERRKAGEVASEAGFPNHRAALAAPADERRRSCAGEIERLVEAAQTSTSLRA